MYQGLANQKHQQEVIISIFRHLEIRWWEITGLGVSGYYWASTPNPVNNGDRSAGYGKVISANCLRFTIDESDIDNVYVRSYYERYVGMQVQKFE